MLIRRRGLRASQQPTDGELDNSSVIMRPERDGETACWRPRLLPRKSEEPTGGTTGYRLHRKWPDQSSTALRTKTEVSGGGELDVDNVEGGENYLVMGRLHLRDDTTRHEFSIVALREPRKPTDHRMVLGLLLGEGVMRHRAYIKGRTTWSIREDKWRRRLIEGDLHFRYLKRNTKKPSRKDRQNSAPWILEKT